MIHHQSKQKAIDHALWLNFKHRVFEEYYMVTKDVKGYYFVIPENLSKVKNHKRIDLPMDYSNLTYDDLRAIGSAEDPLSHWEDIRGMFSTMNGEILRFILKMKIPLERFIRNELANRGYDEDHNWVGFDKADEIWLK